MGKYVLVYQAQQAALPAWGAWFGSIGCPVIADGGRVEVYEALDVGG